MSEEKISIGIGEFAVVTKPCVLESIGLGSCVGICIWDKNKGIGGLAHIMLGCAEERTGNLMRFADKAIDAMIDKMISKGAHTNDMVAKIFGGASLFHSTGFSIGKDNTVAVKKELSKRKIRIIAKDLGGTHGRSIWFDTKTGNVVVGMVFGPTKEY